MKKQTIFRSLIAIAFIGSMTVGCKKNDTTTTTPADDTQQQATSADDENRVQTESDQALDDANTAIQLVPTASGRLDGIEGGGINPICNTTIDTTNKASGIIKIIYNGLNCDGTKSRTGNIKIQLSSPGGNVTKWKTQGATLTLTFDTLKITRISDGKAITLNGTHSITNVNGGLIKNITAAGTVVHQIRGNMMITFDDGTNRTWAVTRTRTYSIANNILSVSLSGDSTIGTFNHIAMSGINRAGEKFSISINTPIFSNIFGGTCLYKALSGQRVFNGIAHPLTVNYGVDANGVAEVSGCPYGYQLSWTNAAGVAKTKVVAY